MNTWVTEKRDVFSDYRQLFGEKEKDPIATGIVILTDSDNRGTHAIGDYGYIQVLSPSGGVPKPGADLYFKCPQIDPDPIFLNRYNALTI
jgi:hypothetical protein